MSFKKGEKRLSNAGRRAGTPNKVTSTCKEAFELAFEGIGGVQALCEWAQANQTEFYKLFSKVLPLQISGEDGKGIVVQIVKYNADNNPTK